ncbi:MAG: aldehyde dehydrogenase family protein [Xanthobacteraceae bacterium]
MLPLHREADAEAVGRAQGDDADAGVGRLFHRPGAERNVKRGLVDSATRQGGGGGQGRISNDDVIRRANATNYGLGASVWPSNSERAHKVANQIEAGTVWINKHLDMAPHIPFGGAKQSGIGTEFAEEGLAEFTQLQIINEAR